MNPADLNEIRYRSDSTNVETLSGFAKLTALDRRDLIDHIDARETQMRQALQAAAEKAYASWKDPEIGSQVAWAAERAYRAFVAIAHDMGLELI